MKCPYCGKENTRVIDSRPTDDSSIRRRRQCDECGKRFTTYEKVETLPLIVVKKDNNREPIVVVGISFSPILNICPSMSSTISLICVIDIGRLWHDLTIPATIFSLS